MYPFTKYMSVSFAASPVARFVFSSDTVPASVDFRWSYHVHAPVVRFFDFMRVKLSSVALI